MLTMNYSLLTPFRDGDIIDFNFSKDENIRPLTERILATKGR